MWTTLWSMQVGVNVLILVHALGYGGKPSSKCDFWDPHCLCDWKQDSTAKFNDLFLSLSGTGTHLSNQRLAPLYTVRGAIHEWASSKGLNIRPPADPSVASPPVDPKDSPIEQFGPLDDPCHCLSIVSSRSVSAYDVGALFRLVQEKTLPQSYAALVLLREMTRHIDGPQLKRIRKELQMDVLKSLLESDIVQVLKPIIGYKYI